MTPITYQVYQPTTGTVLWEMAEQMAAYRLCRALNARSPKWPLKVRIARDKSKEARSDDGP